MPDSSGSTAPAKSAAIVPEDSASQQLGSHTRSLLNDIAHLLQNHHWQKTVVRVTFQFAAGCRSADIDASTCLTWSQFIAKLQDSKLLNVPIQIKQIYSICPKSGNPVYVDEVGALQSEKEYFIETASHKFRPKIRRVTDMDQFYAALKEDFGLATSLVDATRSLLEAGGMTFQILMTGGKYTITDTYLADTLGVRNPGLRLAILSIIENQ